MLTYFENFDDNNSQRKSLESLFEKSKTLAKLKTTKSSILFSKKHFSSNSKINRLSGYKDNGTLRTLRNSEGKHKMSEQKIKSILEFPGSTIRIHTTKERSPIKTLENQKFTLIKDCSGKPKSTDFLKSPNHFKKELFSRKPPLIRAFDSCKNLLKTSESYQNSGFKKKRIIISTTTIKKCKEQLKNSSLILMNEEIQNSLSSYLNKAKFKKTINYHVRESRPNETKFSLIPDDHYSGKSSSSLRSSKKEFIYDEFEKPLIHRPHEKNITQLLQFKLSESPFLNKTNTFYPQYNPIDKERLTITVINQKKEVKSFFNTFVKTSNANELMPLNQEDKRVRNMNSEPINRKMTGRQLRIMMKEALFYLSRLKLDIMEISENVVFSYKPFQKDYSREMIFACKMGKVEDVRKFLMLNKFIVYDFDYLYMTGLHWACKRGHIEIVDELVKHGSDTEAKDMIGRNPLYFAIKHNHNDILLLYHEVTPFSTSGIDLKEACAQNYQAEILLRRARKVSTKLIQIHIAMKMSAPYDRKQIWERQKTQILGDENLYYYGE